MRILAAVALLSLAACKPTMSVGKCYLLKGDGVGSISLTLKVIAKDSSGVLLAAWAGGEWVTLTDSIATETANALAAQVETVTCPGE